MSDVNKQPQPIVGEQNPQPLPQQQQQQQEQEQQQSQPSEAQNVEVAMAEEATGSDQIQGTQVVATNTTMNSTSTMIMATPQPALQNLQNPPAFTPMPNQITNQVANQTPPAITAVGTGPPQQLTDWSANGRFQFIQQPLQNPTYIQPLYNAQGQLIVPGNLALHPGTMNQPIQLIAAGKPFQPVQLPQMLAAPGKPFIQGQTPFPSYATIPTSAGNQAFLISQLGLIGQTNILPQPSQQGKPQEMQKMLSKTTTNNGNMKPTQTQQQNGSMYTCNTQQQRGIQGAAPTMQFSPWQAAFAPSGLPQGLTWAPNIQSPALLTQGSQIFIRNTQTEQTGMFIQNTQSTTTATLPQLNSIAGQQMNKTSHSVEMAANFQAKSSFTKGFSSILPNSAGSQQLKPGGSVSTQTGQTQTTSHQANFRGGPRSRSKNLGRIPNMIPISKTDFANRSKSSTSLHVVQQKFVVSSVTSRPTPGVSRDSRMIKPIAGPSHAIPSTSGISQQPPRTATHVQQTQNIVQESGGHKPSGQLARSNTAGSSGSAALMPPPPPMTPAPVTPAAKTPAPMTPPVGNVVVQEITSAATSAEQQTLQAAPAPEEVVVDAGLPPENTEIKQEIPEENESETGPGRPNDENSSNSDATLTTGNSQEGSRGDRSRSEEGVSVQDNLTEEEKNLERERLLNQTKATIAMAENMTRRMPVEVEVGEPSSKKPHLTEEKDSTEESRVDPLKWTVAEVCEFIRSLPGGAEYVEDFALQDIDGEALMLLQPDHLVSAMAMKLGPAVKIIAKIDTMRVNPDPPTGDEN